MQLPTPANSEQPVALVTGVSRDIGIGAEVSRALADDGWTVATAGYRSYDDTMTWGADADALGHFDVDLAEPESATKLVESTSLDFGSITALILCHAVSVDSSISTTSIESFDRHMAVNARATWLLIRAFAEQLSPEGGNDARIVAITSDHTAHNLPYGASKGAMDRIVIAAADELAHLGLTANVVNPGATDTGWMSSDIERDVRDRNISDRVGQPIDCANLVRFLCSEHGAWVNAQILYSDGGLRR